MSSVKPQISALKGGPTPAFSQVSPETTTALALPFLKTFCHTIAQNSTFIIVGVFSGAFLTKFEAQQLRRDLDEFKGLTKFEHQKTREGINEVKKETNEVKKEINEIKFDMNTLAARTDGKLDVLIALFGKAIKERENH
ncbi:MAG: hypothetical protein Q9197_000418 [Variospora fuerteventurae]